MIGAAGFAVVVVFLTFAQLGFMVELGWKPLGTSDVPWPSGLALGPLGWLQVLNFAFFGTDAFIPLAVTSVRGRSPVCDMTS